MESNAWNAPVSRRPVRAALQIPGSKSLTNRALVLAALADGPSRITNALESRDSDLMVHGLRTLGARIDHLDPPRPEDDEPDILQVTPIAFDRPTGAGGPLPRMQIARVVDCGLAGTVLRFLPPVAAMSTGTTRFTGDPAASRRPVLPLLQALRDLGVPMSSGDRIPFAITGLGQIVGREATIDASGSSQFVSALLLSAARFDHGLTLHHEGPNLPSVPHIEMTRRMLAQHGVEVVATVQQDQATWTVEPVPIRARDRVIEPDLSNATPFAAAAIVTGGRVTVRNWPEASLQPIDRVAEVFSELGGTIRAENGTLVVSGTGRIGSFNGNLADIGELVPTIAALCALGSGTSRLTGIAHLRGHETDRLTALADQINGLGGRVEVTADGLSITPTPLQAKRVWRTYADHRMATAGAILGLRVAGLKVEDIETTGKTFPGFAHLWTRVVNGTHAT